MLAKTLRIFTLILTASLVACGGGSDEADPLSNNACADLGLNTRIINGTACSTNNTPVLPLTLVTRDGSASLCSGTLITSTHILTAAHCFITEEVVSVYTQVAGRRIFGKRVLVHPDALIDANAGKAENDVAVLEMDEAINRPTVPLITSESPHVGDRFSIFGYGLDSSGGLGTLESGQMRISDITPSYIISEFEGEGSNTCNGDSGGPALTTIPDSSQIGLIGVTSSGTSTTCREGDTSFFVNLQAPQIVSFIKSAAPGVQTR